MKKSGIPPIASPSAPPSGGVSVEGGGAGAFEGFPAAVFPPVDLPLPAAPLAPVLRWAWPGLACPPVPAGALCAWGLWPRTSGAAGTVVVGGVEVVSVAPGGVGGLPSGAGAVSVPAAGSLTCP